MGILIDEFSDMLENEVEAVVDKTVYLNDSIDCINKAKNFLFLNKGGTYSGILIDNFSNMLSYNKTEIINWEHVTFTLDVKEMRDVSEHKLQDLVIPDFVEEIKGIGDTGSGFGFNDGSRGNIRHVSIPENLLVIDDNTFAFHRKLESITFDRNSSLMYIGKQAFAYCENLSNLDLSNCEYLENLYKGTFMYSGITKLHLNENIRFIDKDAFIESKIQTIYIGDKVYTLNEFLAEHQACNYEPFWIPLDTFDF